MAGFIYIMSNKSFRGNLIKIGKTERDPSIRKGELYTTGTPDEFNIEYYAFVNNHHEMETRIHSALDKYRYSSSREFFDCDVAKAIFITKDICKEFVKFEEIFFRDLNAIERERNSALIQEEKRKESQRIFQILEERKRILNSYAEIINRILSNEVSRHEEIRKSLPFASKMLDFISPTSNIKEITQNIINDIDSAISSCRANLERKYCGPVDINTNIALLNEIDRHKRAVRFTIVKRFAEHTNRFSSDYSATLYGLITKDGTRASGYCQWTFRENSRLKFEQGLFVNGNKEGEFIAVYANNNAEIQVYEKNVLKSSYNISLLDLDYR